jgi:hypothetical protein
MERAVYKNHCPASRWLRIAINNLFTTIVSTILFIYCQIELTSPS